MNPTYNLTPAQAVIMQAAGAAPFYAYPDTHIPFTNGVAGFIPGDFEFVPGDMVEFLPFDQWECGICGGVARGYNLVPATRYTIFLAGWGNVYLNPSGDGETSVNLCSSSVAVHWRRALREEEL